MQDTIPGCHRRQLQELEGGKKGCCHPQAPISTPQQGKIHLSCPTAQRNSKRKQGSPYLGVHFSPPHSLSHLWGLVEGMLHQELAQVTLAASPLVPSCHPTGRGIKERRAEKKHHGASPSHCRPPQHPPSPHNCEKPMSPRAPPARGWECGSNCTWQGSNSESKTVVWLVSHPGPAALLFSFACLNPFQPWPLTPVGPTAPSPSEERGQAP